MLDRPFYQPALALLVVLTLIGGVVALAFTGGEPGIRIVPAPGSSAGAPASPGSVAGAIDINAAGAEEMAQLLPGIGPILSRRIVDYRETVGPFERPDQIMLVPGIGEGIYEGIRHLIAAGE